MHHCVANRYGKENKNGAFISVYLLNIKDYWKNIEMYAYVLMHLWICMYKKKCWGEKIFFFC